MSDDDRGLHPSPPARQQIGAPPAEATEFARLEARSRVLRRLALTRAALVLTVGFVTPSALLLLDAGGGPLPVFAYGGALLLNSAIAGVKWPRIQLLTHRPSGLRECPASPPETSLPAIRQVLAQDQALMELNRHTRHLMYMVAAGSLGAMTAVALLD